MSSRPAKAETGGDHLVFQQGARLPRVCRQHEGERYGNRPGGRLGGHPLRLLVKRRQRRPDHRRGVQVFKLVTEGTLREKIAALIAKKNLTGWIAWSKKTTQGC